MDNFKDIQFVFTSKKCLLKMDIFKNIQFVFNSV